MLTQDREQTRAAWDQIAAGYDQYVTPTHMWLGREGLKRAGVGAGTRFLDVAAGSGALSLPAAQLGARVLATDVSARMLDRLEQRARQARLGVETRVMDGHELELEDAGFDVTGSQFGVMLFPDVPRALGEMARVTRPGGRVLITAYGSPERIEFLQSFIEAIQAAVPDFTGPPMDPPPLPFQLQDPKKLRRLLSEAGLEDVRVETITEQLEFRSGRQLWDWLVNSNPIVEGVLAELSLRPEQLGTVRSALEDIVRRRAGEAGRAALTNPVNIGVGIR